MSDRAHATHESVDVISVRKRWSLLLHSKAAAVRGNTGGL